MNTGLYAACAGLLARTQALDLAANNLANVNTGGYKAEIPSFRSLLAGTSGIGNTASKGVNEFGVLADSRLNSQQGPIERTGNDLDLALQGAGYFVVQTPEGSRLYTRNGAFHINSHGELVSSNDDRVLGSEGPILLPPGKLSVSANGTVSVDGALAGQVQVVTFSPDAELKPQGSAMFSAAAGSERPASEANVMQGALEGSNVNPVAAAVGLVTLQRHADMLQRALSAFHSEFNRIAAQDLSRI